MRALCWTDGGALVVREVPDPELRNGHDAIVRVRYSATCGSDLHLIGSGALHPGDVLGHEFLGEVVAVGPEVRRHRVGDRVVVGSVVACGRCWYCAQGRHSYCDNGTVEPPSDQPLWAQTPAGRYGYPAALDGFAGSHAEYVRVPYADVGAFAVPDSVGDERAVFASDALPTGWTGVESGGVRPGDVVAVWGAGAVGQSAARAAVLRGASRVVVVDRYDDRLRMVERHVGAETVNYRQVDVPTELAERSGGRGPDVCIEAAGPGDDPRSLTDRLPGRFRGTPRTPLALREAVHTCRKGGTVVVLGDLTGFVDAFPVGAVVRKGLTVRGARPHAPRYIPMLLDRMARDELRTEHLATHRLPLEQGETGYKLFRERADGCVRVLFTPY